MKTVVIIGAGPAGLGAAYELLKRSQDYNVVVLEKADIIGGISQTINHNGNRMDIGGHRFFTKDPRVLKMWGEILRPQGAPAKDELIVGQTRGYPSNGADPEVQDDVMLTRRRVSRLYYKKKFFDYPLSIKFSTIKNMGIFTTFVATLSYIKAAMFPRPEHSLEDFYINRFGKKLYNLFFESYTQKVWGRHPRDLNPSWGRQRVREISMRVIIKNAFAKFLPWRKSANTGTASLIEEFSYPKFGPGQMYERMADIIAKHPNGKVITGAELKNIVTQNGKAVGVKYQKDGQIVDMFADYVISSMPLSELTDALGETDPEILRIAAGLPYRDFIALGLLVDKIKLKNKTRLKTVNGIIPDCWIYVQDASVKLGRVQIFNNWSPYMVKEFPNKIWIALEYFCNEGDELYTMSKEEFLKLGKQELTKIGIIDSDTQIYDFHQAKIKKAYCSYFDTWNELDKLKTRLLQYDGLYCVGRNGQHRYNNMDHSALTGILTVDCILDPSIDKSTLWDINTEDSYHEVKKEL